jgi:hypothetical protein
MATRKRCTECRKTYTPTPRAKKTQRVCGEECRKKRDRKLAKARRRREIVDYRSDERERQQRRRDPLHPASPTSPKERSAAECHAPASMRNASISLKKVEEFVDHALALSRATLMRNLREILGQKDTKAGEAWRASRMSLKEQEPMFS